MAPPYQILDWYGGRPTCHTASGATDSNSKFVLLSLLRDSWVEPVSASLIRQSFGLVIYRTHLPINSFKNHSVFLLTSVCSLPSYLLPASRFHALHFIISHIFSSSHSYPQSTPLSLLRRSAVIVLYSEPVSQFHTIYPSIILISTL